METTGVIYLYFTQVKYFLKIQPQLYFEVS